ncbi:hypothetical protein QEO94_11425 [Kingella negevensis]|uniref:hypothetical protein n=1 Tax=Kingella negevensis TaxID=1522312 RepID=UPI00254373D0|nr:hypothetical protein [Kingella negevensis]WII93210.1 hypothetical protein QEO94_11425 [Kingella negevensis]
MKEKYHEIFFSHFRPIFRQQRISQTKDVNDLQTNMQCVYQGNNLASAYQALLQTTYIQNNLVTALPEKLPSKSGVSSRYEDEIDCGATIVNGKAIPHIAHPKWTTTSKIKPTQATLYTRYQYGCSDLGDVKIKLLQQKQQVKILLEYSHT